MPFPWLAAATGLGTILGIGSGKRQQNRNIELWNKQNEYNHPSAQMARLKEAGLNPNLIYGGSPAGTSGSASSAPKEAEVNVSDPAPTAFAAQAAKTTALTNDNLRAQNDVIIQEKALKMAQTLLTINNSGIAGAKKDIITRTLEDHISQIQSQAGTKLAEWRMNAQNWETSALSEKEKSLVRQANLSGQLLKAKKLGFDASNSEKRGFILDLEAQLKEKNIKYFDSTAILRIFGQILGLGK